MIIKEFYGQSSRELREIPQAQRVGEFKKHEKWISLELNGNYKCALLFPLVFDE